MAEHTLTPESTGRVVAGWTGRLWEDFAVGDIYYHPLGKTVTEGDNQMFTLMTQNVAKTHIDSNFALRTEYKLPLVNSTFILALVTGQSTIDLSMNVFANLGWDEVRMPSPVFEGDTIYSRSKVLATRASKSRPTLGLVTVATEGYNQNSVIVMSYQRTFMVYREGHLPDLEDTRPNEASLPATLEKN
ncbi:MULTISPECIES: MaoC family dehydratase [Cryobacterium]|uniref:Acyl dehydratase n=1 Tax=Cryobacterium levicorallinum TaxID=995038 RepID=A0A1I2ZLG4_9MICO|nr:MULTISPECIES: MaoC family dehydratase [Cryobacterium]TFB89552.1 MaoC family dehydratase [Cryobacterium levicorallinum]TFD56612.1 MaoC family dehydratase [Cryobacterium sp. Hh38]GEP25892.1 molybdenum cofactor biosynthesis protein MoeC [Cryobacterium levicorallinum]SFH38668.1 Acyl dehydratase [Cryobacterium levicorallinum]